MMKKIYYFKFNAIKLIKLQPKTLNFVKIQQV